MRGGLVAILATCLATCSAPAATSMIGAPPATIGAPPAIGRRPPGIVDVQTVDPSIRVDLMYAGADNFLGRPADGYHANVCYLTAAAAGALARAQARLRQIGIERGTAYSLLVRDCYRPRRAVADFVRWAALPDHDATRARYHPDHPRAALITLAYISPVSGHTRGSSVDVTIVELAGDTATPLAMGSAVDFFGARSHTRDPGLTAAERAARQLLLDVMAPEFRNYRKEWWHFVLADEPSRASFDFEIAVMPTARPRAARRPASWPPAGRRARHRGSRARDTGG